MTEAQPRAPRGVPRETLNDDDTANTGSDGTRLGLALETLGDGGVIPLALEETLIALGLRLPRPKNGETLPLIAAETGIALALGVVTTRTWRGIPHAQEMPSRDDDSPFDAPGNTETRLQS